MATPQKHIGKGVRLSLRDLHEVAEEFHSVELNPAALEAMRASHELLSSYVNDRLPVYGVTTQFGNQAHLLDPHIKDEDDDRYFSSIRARQRNLVISHDCGLGEELPEAIARGAMLLRAHCISQGYSGIRPLVPETVTIFLNHGVHPVIYRYGSIGASGDLIPLAASAATLLGLDRPVTYKGVRTTAEQACKEAGITPLVLEGREGLALINGTSFSTSIAGLSLYRLQYLFKQLIYTIAISLEALQVMDSGYESIVHTVKGQKGQEQVNTMLKEFWQGSTLIRHLESSRLEILENPNSDQDDSKNMQDYYSLRSIAQGFGPFAESLEVARGWIENEMNSVNDNPITDASSGKVLHSANFMGYYVTSACDMLKNDIAQASSWIHALFANFVHARKSFGLPTNLVERADIYSAFRPLQLLVASITVQNRKLAQAQQAYMIPTEGDNQDVNSLSKHAAFDFREAVANLERLTALLFLAAMQALDLRGVTKASVRAKAAHEAFRAQVSFLTEDRMMHNDIAKTIEFLRVTSL